MSGTWLPDWLALLITAALAVAVARQLQHLPAVSGRHAAWHGGHLLMGLNTIAMYLPTPSMLVPAAAGTVVFAAAAITAGVLLLWAIRRRGGGLLWLLLLADFAWMASMYRAMEQPVHWLSAVGAPHHRYLRASLTVMALAMGYMFLTMAVGSSPTASTPGMSHAGH